MSFHEPHAPAAEPTAPPDPAPSTAVEDDELADAPPVAEPRPPATGFLPTSPARLGVESVFVRLIATAGVVGVGTALGAILVANDVAGWIVGIAVSVVSVVLAALLWRSRRL
jgi:hypothetical protein